MMSFWNLAKRFVWITFSLSCKQDCGSIVAFRVLLKSLSICVHSTGEDMSTNDDFLLQGRNAVSMWEPPYFALMKILFASALWHTEPVTQEGETQHLIFQQSMIISIASTTDKLALKAGGLILFSKMVHQPPVYLTWLGLTQPWGGRSQPLDKIHSRQMRTCHKPVAQRQEMVIGTLALLWYFWMVAVM